MKKIRVLMVAGTMDLGGIENQLMHLLRNADKDQFQFDFTSTLADPYYRREIQSLGGRCIPIPEMRRSNPIPYCRTLYRIMKDGKYDIVHSHELFHSGIVLWLAHLAGIKGRFAHAHNWRDGIGSRTGLIRRLYHHAMGRLIRLHSTHQLACSTPAGRFLYGRDFPDNNTSYLVFNSVNTGRFVNNACQAISEEFCDGWINILHAGRMTAVKNQLFLTQIAEEFKRRGRHIRILCAGCGNAAYEAEVRRSIATRRLEDHIRLLGPRNDLDALMAVSAAFVLPSHYEGMPLVLIEAQAAGLPCVCADTFSHEVDFGLDQIRWLSLSGGPALWADTLEQAVASGKAPKDAIVQAISEKGFDSRTFAQTLCALYTDCCRSF